MCVRVCVCETQLRVTSHDVMPQTDQGVGLDWGHGDAGAKTRDEEREREREKKACDVMIKFSLQCHQARTPRIFFVFDSIKLGDKSAQQQTPHTLSSPVFHPFSCRFGVGNGSGLKHADMIF